MAMYNFFKKYILNLGTTEKFSFTWTPEQAIDKYPVQVIFYSDWNELL